MDNQIPDTEKMKKRKRPVFLIIFVILLAFILGYLGYTYSELKKQSEVEKAELQRQKERLEGELLAIYNQYDSLKSENDTMNLKLTAEQDRIEKLLKINANNVYKIRMYEKELETIRKVLRSYIVQIDSLNQANISLRAENIEVKQQLKKAVREKDELSQTKEELSTMVDKASVLAAKNIVVSPLNRRSKEQFNTKWITKLRVCFILRENAIIASGPKNVYMRIARPDDIILTSGVNFFEFQGEQIVYTASREIEYENVDVEMCIYWTNDGQLIPGVYRVSLFAESDEIGITTFSLK